MDFLYGFLTWFKSFFGHMLDGFLMIFKGLVFGIGQIFDFTYYFRIWAEESVNFGVLDWIRFGIYPYFCRVGRRNFPYRAWYPQIYPFPQKPCRQRRFA